ncbi:conserved Plasmodium protein, unknown function [Plasmodium gallinaceum]|uniref:RAP domain-containing protein n=1 Tax=Plasmodium gallinaceum TaxID=5849 RepID=A0A1J1GUC1_PLAGA|nr:conserved Plasmodium protein, unknown function [Plasmodium gallinaceum]CRG94911.1 conserved Plasmodium protein, unknown function [Plasmodium gallinaceum]
MMIILFRNILRRSFSSLKNELQKFETLSKNFVNSIEKYKQEKDISITSYVNYKKEIKECIGFLFNNNLDSLEEKDFKTIFTYSILLSRRVLIHKDLTKNVLLRYITIKKENKEKCIDDNQRYTQKDEIKELLLMLKFLFYLNIDFDKVIYNYLYSELNNEIEFYTLEELVETIKIISSFKNKKWVNYKVFSRCINEVIKRNQEEKNDIYKFLITIIKSCSRLNYEIYDIQDLLESFRQNYDKNIKGNMHILIKVLYNLFLCNYHNYKNTNQLINILKEEIMQVKKEEDYPLYNKYLYNSNVILDNNLDFNTGISKNEFDVNICNDNINNIHEMYFKTKERSKDILSNSAITSINLYRLKFIDLVIRSDNYLYNCFYSPNSHFFDFIKQLNLESKNTKETIFSKQVKFFIRENGFRIEYKYVNIYPIVFLSDFKNTYVEFVHNICINKKMKDSPNIFHKNYLNYKIKHLKFLGWDAITLYEYEWKKLRSYNEKFEYIKKAFKSIKSSSQ